MVVASVGVVAVVIVFSTVGVCDGVVMMVVDVVGVCVVVDDVGDVVRLVVVIVVGV